VEISRDGLAIRFDKLRFDCLQWRHVLAASIYSAGGSRFLVILPTDFEILYHVARSEDTRRCLQFYEAQKSRFSEISESNVELFHSPICLPEYCLPVQLDDIVSLINTRKSVASKRMVALPSDREKPLIVELRNKS